jgi:hypothetical protein
LGRRETAKFFAMGLDSRDHTKSGPSGRIFFYTTSFGIAAQTREFSTSGKSPRFPFPAGGEATRKRRIPS